MTFEMFFLTYGYLAVFAGALLEGDATLLAAGYLARRGYLDLTSVVVVAALGALVKDHIIFGVGKLGGEAVLARKPKWYRRVKKIRRRLRRHHALVALTFRFLPVVAIATPLALGIGGTSYRRFVVLDLVGIVIWAVVVGFAGSAIGHAVEWIGPGGMPYAKGILLALVLAGAAAWLYRARQAAQSKA
jgi:membrane protein DedA with SNARE-associated domain